MPNPFLSNTCAKNCNFLLFFSHTLWTDIVLFISQNFLQSCYWKAHGGTCLMAEYRTSGMGESALMEQESSWTDQKTHLFDVTKPFGG